MNLIELIENGVSYDDILYHDDWTLGIRICRDLGDAFVYCHPATGEFVKEYKDYTGYKRVVLCKKILADDTWNKRKIVRNTVTPKYKIGDRFLLSDMYYGESKILKASLNTTLKNVVGKIIAYYQDDEEGNVLYTVSLGGASFPLLLNEDYLSKLDMVVSQND